MVSLNKILPTLNQLGPADFRREGPGFQYVGGCRYVNNYSLYQCRQDTRRKIGDGAGEPALHSYIEERLKATNATRWRGEDIAQVRIGMGEQVAARGNRMASFLG